VPRNIPAPELDPTELSRPCVRRAEAGMVLCDVCCTSALSGGHRVVPHRVRTGVAEWTCRGVHHRSLNAHCGRSSQQPRWLTSHELGGVQHDAAA